MKEGGSMVSLLEGACSMTPRVRLRRGIDWLINSMERGLNNTQMDRPYTGMFFKGTKHGKGEFIWPEVGSYKGEFHLNQFHGKGTYTWNDGRCYRG